MNIAYFKIVYNWYNKIKNMNAETYSVERKKLKLRKRFFKALDYVWTNLDEYTVWKKENYLTTSE